MPPTNQNPGPWTAPGQTPPPQANYDFFLHPAPAPRQPLLKLSGGSFAKRLTILIGGALGLIILLIIVSALLGSGPNVNPLIVVAQDQNELVRVATEANGQATAQTTQNLGQEVELSLTSAQQQLLAYLISSGHTLGTSQLSATKNAQTDKTLTSATSSSNFDAAFVQIMQSELKSYVSNLKSAYSAASPAAKTLLKSQYDGGEILLNMANSTLSSLPSQ